MKTTVNKCFSDEPLSESLTFFVPILSLFPPILSPMTALETKRDKLGTTFGDKNWGQNSSS